MSIRRMMLFTLGAKIKNLIEAFKTRVFAAQGEFEAETCLEAQLTDLDNKGLLDSASLIVTPNAYEENILFAVKPDKVGTNLLLHSQDWTQSVWDKGGATIVSSTRVAPDGTSTGTELSDVGASSTPNVTIQSNIVATSTNVVYSIYTKAVSLPTNGRRIFLLRNSTTSTNFDFLNFNYSSTGNLGNGWFSQNVGNGWFRLSYTRTTGISIGNLLTVYYGRTGAAPVGATDVWQVWGAQVDTSTTLNEYIPTTSARIINGTIGDMSVTRATTGTRVNADGLIEEVPYNLFQRSEEFDNASWIKSTSTISSNVTTAPNGTLTADRLVENIAVGNSYYIQQSAQGNINTVSIYAKAETRSKLNIFFTAHNSNATFDLIAGTVFSTSGTITASIESVGNGWYRCIASTTLTTHISIRFYLANDAGSVIYNGNGTSGLFIWGAQLVTGTQPRDYFPTTNRFNIPRIDYSNGSCPSILVEPQRTNLLLRSEEFNNVTIWPGSAGVTRLANQATAPDGTNTMDLLTFPVSGNSISQSVTVVSGTTYTFSIWLATQSGTQSVEIGNINAGVYQSVTVTNTPQRFQITQVASATNRFPAIRATASYSVLAWGAQLEVGSNATSYIPTVASTVTRNADVISNTNMSTLIGQTEGAMFVDVNYEKLNTLADNIFSTISDGTISNSLVFAVFSNGNFVTVLRASGSIQVQFIIPAASFTFGRKKIVISYKSGETNLYVNGVKIGSTNTNAFTFPVTINKFNLGSSWGGGSSANNAINLAALYKTTLTDAQAIQLTTL